MNIQSIILFLVVGVLFFSCTKEEIVNRPEQMNGTATRITLTLKSERQQLNEKRGLAQTNRALPFPYGVPTTGSMIGSKTFCPEDESLITNVQILVFDPTGEIVSNNYIGKLNFSEAATIVSETYCGENMDVWVVANGDVNDTEETPLNTKLQKVKSINDLQALLISTKENGLSRSDRLTMVGNTTITITPNMEAISLQMHYLAAKVTVTVTDNTPADVEITITGWDVVNIPKQTYLKERMKEDAVNGTVSTDYLTTTEEYPFETIGTKSWGQSFYLFENRRGKRVDRALPTNPSERYPGMSVSDNNQRGKAWFAPPGATYMLIYGTYNKSGQMNNVVYKIYLGENAHNNYDVVRGKHYTFNVTIKGLSQIDIDTTVDWGNSSFTVTPYGDLEAMDAHPDFRVLRIGATAIDAATPGYAIVEVLNNDNTACEWLSVSPLNLYRHGIKQAGNQNQPFDDAVGCFVRTKYNPIVAEELSFTNATFGMTRKLTEIPFPQLTVLTFQDVVVYADEFDDTSGSGVRKAKIRVTYYDSNNVSSAIGQFEFEVCQQSAIKISDDLYLERYEEARMMLQPSIIYSLQAGNAAEMQWGYSSQVLYGNSDRYTNGNYLTANAVYKHIQTRKEMDAPAWTTPTYDEYREKYPLTGEKITEPVTGLETESVYYYPILATEIDRTLFFDPIYNSSAARYCHEKNRDANGNGIIDEDETVWYLPSLADMIYIRRNVPSGITLTSIFWTSSEENANNSWAYNMGTSDSKSAVKTTRYQVRCVKGKGVALPDPVLHSGQTDPTKMKFDYLGSQTNYISIQDRTGLPWTVASNQEWLKFNIKNTGTGVADSYSGSNNGGYYVYATANPNYTVRTATITLKRRDSSTDKIISVTQERKIPPAIVKPLNIELGFLTGESMAFDIDDQGSGIQWTVRSSDPSWLRIAKNARGDDAAASISGTGKATLYAYTISNNNSDSADRKSSIILSQTGTSSSQINIIQKFVSPCIPPAHKGWAGSNIYWDESYNNGDGTKGRLTFDDLGVKDHADYQGVYFFWGSLVAISPVYPYAKETSIIFSPSALLLDGSVQQPTKWPSGTNPYRHFALEIHDPRNNIGDICTYITERGWAPGKEKGRKWRMPTGAELGPTTAYTLSGNLSVVALPVLRNGKRKIPSAFIRDGASFPVNGWTGVWSVEGWSPGLFMGYMHAGIQSTTFDRKALSNERAGYTAWYELQERLAGIRCVVASEK